MEARQRRVGAITAPKRAFPQARCIPCHKSETHAIAVMHTLGMCRSRAGRSACWSCELRPGVDPGTQPGRLSSKRHSLRQCLHSATTATLLEAERARPKSNFVQDRLPLAATPKVIRTQSVATAP